MASGIERDEIIEQMTLGTTTKINNAKRDITKLEWKQEAYRSVSDKIIDLSDKYGTYSSASSLVDPTFFAKSLISVHGSDKSSKYVTATGTSDLVGNVAISAVKQLATSSVRQSEKRVDGALTTKLTDLEKQADRSNLNGTKIVFGIKTGTDDKYQTVTFELPSSYETNEKDEKGNYIKKTINYLAKTDKELEELANDLTAAFQKKKLKIGETELKDIRFDFEKGADGKNILKINNAPSGLEIMKSSSALTALGYTGSRDDNIKIEDFNKADNRGDFYTAAVAHPTYLKEMTGSKVAFNFDGSQKQIEMITKEEAEVIAGIKVGDTFTYKDKDGNDQTVTVTEDNRAQLQLEEMQRNLQKRLNVAFGTDNVKVDINAAGALEFKTKNPESSISIASGDQYVMQNLGVGAGESNKINLNGKLSQQNLGINLVDKDGNAVEDYKDGLVINGVTIGGITKDTSISTILSKINSSKAGVKATYVDATGQFMLVSSETGEGREINLDSKLAQDLFGGSADKGASLTKGQNALVEVSYGNGVKVDLSRGSNTFNLEGLTVTVSGVFGGEYEKNADGTDKLVDGKKVWKSDSSDTVTFTAKADVDGVTERVKGFFEDFNAMVKEVNSQITTRPDSSYMPLTDEQKAEMSETSIENWEKKAKQGLLYGDSAMRDLSTDIQGIFVKMMNSGASYEDLKKIGITYSDDYLDGGTLVFDEAKFRTAMENDPDIVANIFTGGGGVSKGITQIVDETLTPYATRYASKNGNSYGRLVDEAGSEKAPTTMMNNFIYKQIKEMQDKITSLQSKLQIEQDRYIKQFSTMESLISQMNSQSSWLSQLSG